MTSAESPHPGLFRRLAPWAMVLLAAALLVPALVYSLQTDFGLIDDISDWEGAAQRVRSPAHMLEWCRTTFFTFGPGRYRPMFELGNMAAWSLWGPHPALHHAARWIMKLLALAALLLALRQRAPRMWAPWPALLLTYLFLFYPNQPDARLAPQELNSVLFLAWLTLILAQLHRRYASNLAAAKGRTLVWLYAACVGLSWSKEINIALLACVSVWLIGWAVAHRSRAAGLRAAPVVLLTLYTILRLAAAASGKAYGVEALSLALWQSNLAWLAEQWLQTSTSWLIALVLVGLAGGLLINRVRRLSSLATGDWFDILVGAELGALLLMVSTSWRPVLRYWYPLVPLLAFLAATATAHLQVVLAARGRRYVQGLELTCGLFLLYFVSCNLHAFYAQYAVQHHARLIEHMLIDDASARIADGHHVFNRLNPADSDWEFNRSLELYFNAYLPHFTGTTDRLQKTPPPHAGEGYLLASAPFTGAVRLLKTYERDWPSPFMAATYTWSAHAQGRKVIQTRIDAGTSDPMTYRWYLYRVNP